LIAEDNLARNHQLHFGSRIDPTVDGQLCVDPSGAFLHPGESKMLTLFMSRNIRIDSPTVIPNP
jgi:hypothetical protein